MRFWLLLLAAFACFPAGTWAQDLAAEEIMQRSSNVDKVPDWAATSSMRLIAADGGERVRRGMIYNKLQEGGQETLRLFKFLAPEDVKDTTVLVHEHRSTDDDMWIYLPALKKSRRILSNSRKSSFVGTDFAYADVATPRVRDYNHTLLRREPIDGKDCYVIESLPKDDKVKNDVGYSKMTSWVAVDNFVTLRTDYLNIAGEPYKSQTLLALREVDKKNGKWLAEQREMRNLKTGHRTLVKFDDIKVNQGISRDFFSPNRLKD
jgi:hypothetical protein